MELYIHIPFCRQKCTYCSFISFPATPLQKDEYIELLLQEIEIRKTEFSEPVSTIYIGGGTPSLLSSSQLSHLICGLKKTVSLADCNEFSIEANPGTVTESFLETAACLGINRISFGMQAKQTRILKLLGRIHTFEDVAESVRAAQKNNLENINLDLIFGVPGQTMSDWNDTLNAALSLYPKHISAYGLIPEEGTPLYENLKAGKYALPDPELERDMYDLAIRKLKDEGFRQYEISNFSLDGYACKHNIGYWTQVPYVGLGLSAASMLIVKKGKGGLHCLRRNNPESLHAYRETVLSGDNRNVSFEQIVPSDSRFETMMLSLRMNQGINEQRFLDLHGISLQSCFGVKLHEMKESGLMDECCGSWFLTRKGMDIQNRILLEFMDDP